MLVYNSFFVTHLRFSLPDIATVCNFFLISINTSIINRTKISKTRFSCRVNEYRMCMYINEGILDIECKQNLSEK